MSIEFMRTALADLDQAEDDIAAYQRSSVAVFQVRLERTLQLLESFPLSAPVFEPEDSRYPGMRYRPVRRFRSYAIFYQPIPDGIRVLRVLHTSRNVAAIFSPPTDDPN